MKKMPPKSESEGDPLKEMQKIVARTGMAMVAVLVIIQFIPYGHEHTDPPVVHEPPWNTPETRLLARRACFDCHSNETVWPWYSNVAPASWLTQSDVEEARSLLNFSDWSPAQKGNPHAAAEVREGDMPPWDFLLMHKEARLSDSERETLARGLQATLAAARP